MPRDGSGVYSPPPGSNEAAPNTTILSALHNALVNDLSVALNTAWPVSLGGTGSTDNSFLDGQWRLKNTADPAKKLAFDLSKITTGTTRTLTVQDKNGTIALTSDIASTATKTDVRRNRIINGDMSVSQENGNTSGTTNGYYVADQWAVYRVTSAGTITAQRVQSSTPAGATDRLRVTITTADTSLAAGEMLSFTQNLEGSNVKDFLYGTAGAKATVLRFGFKGPAGTYAAALHNSGATRSFVALFTIAAGQANTDTVQEIAIPGDTTGTWLNADGVIGITLDIVLACGSTFQGVTGWQAGNILGTSGVSNGMGTASAVFELFDVGQKLDPVGSGAYGLYEVGGTDPIYRSERYWERAAIVATASFSSFPAPSGQWTVLKASAPAVTTTVFAGSGAAFITFTEAPRQAFVQSVVNSSNSRVLVTGNARLS